MSHPKCYTAYTRRCENSNVRCVSRLQCKVATEKEKIEGRLQEIEDKHTSVSCDNCAITEGSKECSLCDTLYSNWEPIELINEDDLYTITGAKKEIRTAPKNNTKEGNKYLREIKGISSDKIDVYGVIETFNVNCPARQHAIKKILCTGIRGKGDAIQDLTEAIEALKRAVELEQERKE